MNNLFRDDKDINVVFLGGSITEGAGASEKSRCFANRTGEWLKTKFGDRINYHNKGVGGTPSSYGLLRFDRDVAAYNPDMVFVEFAVNDFGEDTRKYVEGIVRSLASLPTNPYVVFLYTTDEVYSTKTDYFEEVAEYYGIPQIFLKEALRKHLNGENAREAGFLKDKVHPTDKGYEVYYNEMVRCLSEKEYYKRPYKKECCLVEDCIRVHTKFTSSWDAELIGGWKKIETAHDRCIIGAVNDSFEFEFDGDVLAFEHGLHEDSAIYEVYADGELIGTGNPWFDEFTTNQLVLGFNTFNLKSGHHKIKVVNKESDVSDRTNKQVLIYNIITGEKIDEV